MFLRPFCLSLIFLCVCASSAHSQSNNSTDLDWIIDEERVFDYKTRTWVDISHKLEGFDTVILRVHSEKGNLGPVGSSSAIHLFQCDEGQYSVKFDTEFLDNSKYKTQISSVKLGNNLTLKTEKQNRINKSIEKMQIAGTVGLRCVRRGKSKSAAIQLILYMGFLESGYYSFRTFKFDLNVQDFQ